MWLWDKHSSTNTKDTKMSKLTKTQNEAVAGAVKAVTGFKMGAETSGVQHVEAGNIVSRSGRKWKTSIAFSNDGGKLKADLTFTETGDTKAKGETVYSSENLSGEKLRDFIKYRGRRLCLKGADIQRILRFFNSIVPSAEAAPKPAKKTTKATKPKATETNTAAEAVEA
ncbi:hypothetical protein [Xanthomonas phage BUDD]|nr:hypothetical protein [Xanthomonas phage BUDD]